MPSRVASTPSRKKPSAFGSHDVDGRDWRSDSWRRRATSSSSPASSIVTFRPRRAARGRTRRPRVQSRSPESFGSVEHDSPSPRRAISKSHPHRRYARWVEVRVDPIRVFDASTVPNTGGTYNVTESFISGRFVTVAGPSPDSCDPTGTKGTTIGDGVTGSFNGNFLVVVTDGVFNSDATCDPTSCGTTAAFLATVYGAGATFNVTSFGFTYHANGPDPNQREWSNASADQGGNGGDIRST